ncbi:MULTISPECIES: NAD kinase [Enterococcus]|uniref:NAD kinase n=1 Tax=Enterococcus sulfureus ATCC 49903 TaxID=1140003 RepID=S0L3P0_9ENTE|nr:NAD kinase [Enterococcus sulfureus]EOT51472.1 inorganic polyphosphate/ATP-NAD kinase [Enterococcus sulfureus ATCC 49903]EOT87129.1 inorganic polyphosphate/ATP-NAD kinase [Enterococcus sulfureus ATCC 49903]
MEKVKIAIIHNKTPLSLKVMSELSQKLIASGHEINQTEPELVISVGGDGTLLSAFHLFNHKLDQVRFLGVHTGHLGFYTDWRDYELDELVASLNTKQEASVRYPLLDVRITYRNGKEPKHFLSLNESTIKRNDSTMVADIYIKDEFFERFRGDGLSIATPTGSTAYNKSIGGAVLHPRINAIQLTEIASLNNRVFRTLGSPMVIGSHEWIEVRLQESDECVITIDQFRLQQDEIDSIYYKIADENIQFASYRHTHFWRRVRDAFIGES